MKLRNLFLSTLLLLSGVAVYGQATTGDYIKIDDCTLTAGVDDVEIGMVDVNLVNANDWCSLQFDLYLPDGVSMGYYDSDPQIWNTDRLTYTQAGKTKDFAYDQNEVEPGHWRVVAYNMQNAAIKDPVDGDNAIFQIRLVASDMASTGVHTAYIKNARLAMSSPSESDDGTYVVEGAKCPEEESSFQIQINAKIGNGGLGTFSWPRDLDFSEIEDVNLYAITEIADDYAIVKLIEDKKVPAGTGFIIEGNASSTVNPLTTEAEVSAVESILGQTSTETYTVGSDDVYALATKSGKTAFYRCSQGVVIPKYKAYLVNSSSSNMIALFDETTGIKTLNATTDEGDIYNIEGQKVLTPKTRGIYIQNGKKVVVK